MLDAYTVRKAVPRILIAVIGINLSIYLCVSAVEITAIIGRGIGELLTQPFGGVSVDGKDFSGNIVLNAGVLAALIIGIYNAATIGTAIIGAIFPLVLMVVLIALAVLFTLIIRQALVIFLTVTSPVAIACFVLPGTEKYFKKWLDLFVKTLLVYPIIAVMFAMSNVMGSILLADASQSSALHFLNNTATLNPFQFFAQSPAGGGDTEQAVKLIAAIIVLYAPLVLIPFAFKLAGGAIAAVMNAASGATQRRRGELADQRRKTIGEAKATRKENIAEGKLFKGGTPRNFRGRLNRGFQSASIVRSGRAGVNPAKVRSRMQSLQSTAEFDAAKKAKEDSNARAVLVNDTLMNAVLAGDMTEQSAREYLQGQGQTGRQLEQNVAAIRQARRAVGGRALEIAAATSLPGTKTAYMGEHGDAEMLRDAVNVARGDQTLEGLIMNEQRSAAQGAGRFDLAGYGFGTGLSAMNDIRTAMGTGSKAEIDKAVESSSLKLQEDALTHLSAGQIMSGHGSSVNRMMRAANRRVQEASDDYKASFSAPSQERLDDAQDAVNKAMKSGDQLKIDKARAEQHDIQIFGTPEGQARAERKLKQKLALSANLIDVAGQVGGENAQIAANAHLSSTYTLPDGKIVRISDAITDLRNDPVFAQMRREYGGGEPKSPEEIERLKAMGGSDLGSGQPPDITKLPGQ